MFLHIINKLSGKKVVIRPAPVSLFVRIILLLFGLLIMVSLASIFDFIFNNMHPNIDKDMEVLSDFLRKLEGDPSSILEDILCFQYIINSCDSLLEFIDSILNSCDKCCSSFIRNGSLSADDIKIIESYLLRLIYIRTEFLSVDDQFVLDVMSLLDKGVAYKNLIDVLNFHFITSFYSDSVYDYKSFRNWCIKEGYDLTDDKSYLFFVSSFSGKFSSVDELFKSTDNSTKTGIVYSLMIKLYRFHYFNDSSSLFFYLDDRVREYSKDSGIILSRPKSYKFVRFIMVYVVKEYPGVVSLYDRTCFIVSYKVDGKVYRFGSSNNLISNSDILSCNVSDHVCNHSGVDSSNFRKKLKDDYIKSGFSKDGISYVEYLKVRLATVNGILVVFDSRVKF